MVFGILRRVVVQVSGPRTRVRGGRRSRGPAAVVVALLRLPRGRVGLVRESCHPGLLDDRGDALLVLAPVLLKERHEPVRA